MRTTTAAALLALLSASSVATLAACSTGGDDADGAASAASIEDQSRAALRILGANIQGETRNPSDSQCRSCHDANKMTLKKWSEGYTTTLAFLQRTDKSNDEKINFMRRNPQDTGTGFAPAKLGILTAGTHFELGATIDPVAQPKLLKLSNMIAEIFRGKPELYARFQADTLMPIEARYDRLSAAEYETLLRWFDGGMPNLDRLVIETGRPTKCEDDFAGLAEHARQISGESWAAQNRNAGLKMFGCDPSRSSLECFTEKTAGGGDLFPESRAVDTAKSWSPTEDKFRILRVLNYQTRFWMRTSPDGRFVANGGGPRSDDGLGAVVADLEAAHNTSGAKTRDIGVNGNYDPDFFPSNQGFMFQGDSRYCPLSLLRDARVTKLTLKEAGCSQLQSVGLYQTVGQVKGQNAISDIFALNSTFASDSPGLSSSDHDTDLSAGPDATIKVHVGVSLGSDSGYKMMQHQELPTPYMGDAMMSRTGDLVGLRVAGENSALGYQVDRLTHVERNGEPGYAMTLNKMGSVCMPGNKANFSFDERFLVTHHYLTDKDMTPDEWAKYRSKGAADIYLADFVTGTKTRITRMAPGQFALYPHFRSDGWLYFLVRDANTRNESIVATDSALRASAAHPL